MVFDWLHACTYTGLSLLLLFHGGRWDDCGGSRTYTPCATTHRNGPYTQHTHVYTMHTHYREEAEAEVEEPPEEVDTEGIMMRMLRILKPGESVLKVG